MRKNCKANLRKAGKQYVIVQHALAGSGMSTVYTLNSTASYLWEQLGDREFTTWTLVHLLCEKFEVDEDVARQDIERLIDEWRKLELIC